MQLAQVRRRRRRRRRPPCGRARATSGVSMSSLSVRRPCLSSASRSGGASRPTASARRPASRPSVDPAVVVEVELAVGRGGVGRAARARRTSAAGSAAGSRCRPDRGGRRRSTVSMRERAPSGRPVRSSHASSGLASWAASGRPPGRAARPSASRTSASSSTATGSHATSAAVGVGDERPGPSRSAHQYGTPS